MARLIGRALAVALAMAGLLITALAGLRRSPSMAHIAMTSLALAWTLVCAQALRRKR